MNSGLELWQEAITAIPGGNGLLSKRPDRYVPDLWPTYFSRCRGVEVWDLDGNKFIDMAQMGIGSAILGYSNEYVNERVKRAIDEGVNCTLNAPEEAKLARKLLELNPFAGGVKFARTGGEAMAIAVRIARASSGRDKVAFSGYHGWSDWYLATNIQSDSNLDQHLLPGLEPKGVPKSLSGTAIPFEYNNLESLEKLLNDHNNIGVIVIEGARYDFPSNEFLDYIQRMALEKGIIIISDEITSGFRYTDGGVYKINGFKPDIVVYGKAMGNGFAISAVVGKSKVMDSAQDTFISSTFWTERVGFVAALSTIEVITQNKVWDHLVSIGEMIESGWKSLAEKHDLKIKTTDFKPLITMKFDCGDLNNKVVTLFIQEMLFRGYLSSTSVYVSYAHTKEVIEEYLSSVDDVFGIIKCALDQNIDSFLKTKVREDGFKRLTKL